MRKYLYPTVPLKSIPRLLLMMLYGGLIAGIYGIIHDQITYTLSPEYYTTFKFYQFDYADLGLGNRVFAGTVGFLATFWIGMMIGWFFGRLSMLPGESAPRPKLVLKGMMITFATCVAFGLVGYIYGTVTRESLVDTYGENVNAKAIEISANFDRVGHIHNMSYAGGIIGAILAGIFVIGRFRKPQATSQ